MDWTQITLALIVGLPAIIASTAAFITSLRNGRLLDHNTNLTAKANNAAIAAARTGKDAGYKLDTLQTAINGRVEQLVSAAYAKGKLEAGEQVANNTAAIADHDDRLTTVEKGVAEILAILRSPKKGAK